MKYVSCIIGAASVLALTTPALADSEAQTTIATLKTEVQELMAQVKAQAAQIKDLQQQQQQMNKQASNGGTSQKQQVAQTYAASTQLGGENQTVASPPHNWSGPYAGVSFGAGMTSGKIEDKDFAQTSDSFSNGVVQGGVHAGYNRQINNAVLGIEGEINLGSQDHKGHFEGDSTGFFATSSQIDWSGAMLGRAGIAIGDTLLFIDAGPAIAHLKGSAIGEGATSGVNFNVDTWTPGMKGGAGIEVFVTPNVSIRAQYSILDLIARSANTPACPSGSTCRDTWTNMQQTATIGADWHF